MVKRELKSNIKALLIFLLIIVGLSLSVSLLYPSLSKNFENINEMLTMFPEEMLKAFNLDIANLATFTGWFLSEGYIMIQLLSACYFAMLGGSILLKETNDGTIDFLYSKPVSKKQIINAKLQSGAIYVIIFNLFISISLLIGLRINNEFEIKQWLLISVLPFFTSLFFFTTSVFISLFLKKTNQSTGINIGLVFLFYFLNMIAMLAEKVDFLKYLSIFYYTDSKDIIENNYISMEKIFPVILVIAVVRYLSIKIYSNKELSL